MCGGTKTLMLLRRDNKYFYNASTCRDNCAKWILKISLWYMQGNAYLIFMDVNMITGKCHMHKYIISTTAHLRASADDAYNERYRAIQCKINGRRHI